MSNLRANRYKLLYKLVDSEANLVVEEHRRKHPLHAMRIARNGGKQPGRYFVAIAPDLNIGDKWETGSEASKSASTASSSTAPGAASLSTERR